MSPAKNNFLLSFIIAGGLLCLHSCSPQQQIVKSAKQKFFSAKGLQNAHIGISIFDGQTGKYLYDHNGDKYFVPASNTKIPTCYVAMKYLGDSIPGMKVQELNDRLIISGAADPTFLDPEFSYQPVFDFLKKSNKPIFAIADSIHTGAWGSGWSWSDFGDDYMAERSSLPIYSNLVWFYAKNSTGLNYFPKSNFKIIAEGNGDYLTNVTRDFRTNSFTLQLESASQKEFRVPFITSPKLGWSLLADTLHKKIEFAEAFNPAAKIQTIYSQPTDSVLRIMMHRSDNFFAEQCMLMASNALLKEMTNARFIDTILKTDFRLLPQPPVWVDGSGLSRYNLYTPQDFVFILKKMGDEFGMKRIKNIFPTGGSGTLSAYYKDDEGYIFAKTGTLSGVVSLSGFLYTKKHRLLIFSILVNNHHTSAMDIRKAIEKFIKNIREKY